MAKSYFLRLFDTFSSYVHWEGTVYAINNDKKIYFIIGMHIHWGKTLDAFETQYRSSFNIRILTQLLIFAFWWLPKAVFSSQNLIIWYQQNEWDTVSMCKEIFLLACMEFIMLHKKWNNVCTVAMNCLYIVRLSLECYFGVHSPRCFANNVRKRSNITLSWAHKQFALPIEKNWAL